MLGTKKVSIDNLLFLDCRLCLDGTTGTNVTIALGGDHFRALIHGLLSLLGWYKEGFDTPNSFNLDRFNTIWIFIVGFRHAFGNGMPCDGCRTRY